MLQIINLVISSISLLLITKTALEDTEKTVKRQVKSPARRVILKPDSRPKPIAKRRY